MTNSIFGRAPVVDFDGTLAPLDVPWDDLRRELGVGGISDLWSAAVEGGWQHVRNAEVAAAAVSEPVERVMRTLEDAHAIAILSDNSEDAVWGFLERFPVLAARVALVVGRETLGGPKKDFAVFARGFESCVAATRAARGDEPVVYGGDQAYELEFARRLGARTVDVRVFETGA